MSTGNGSMNGSIDELITARDADGVFRLLAQMSEGDRAPYAETVPAALGLPAQLYLPKLNTAIRQLEEEAEQQTVTAELSELLGEIPELEDGADDGQHVRDMEKWAIANVARLATLPPVDWLAFYGEFGDRGVSAKFRDHLQNTVRDLRRTLEAQRAADDPYNPATLADYQHLLDEYGYDVAMNDCSDTIEVNGVPLTDAGRATIDMRFYDDGIDNPARILTALTATADQNRYNPMHEYLNGLQWDGDDHIAALACYLHDGHAPVKYGDGTERTVIHAFMRRWLIGAVAKTLGHNPTLPPQNFMLVLDGGQNLGKSMFCRWLMSGTDFNGFVESDIKPDVYEHQVMATTTLVWEVGELDRTTRKADISALKQFLTTTTQTYRPKYGRFLITKPVTTSFIGTINNTDGFLTDTTGNRRFCPVKIVSIQHSYQSDLDPDQVWAQAVQLWRNDEPWQLTEEERAVHAEREREYETDEIAESYLLMAYQLDPEAEFVPTSVILNKMESCGYKISTSRHASAELSRVASRLGLERVRRGGVRGYAGLKPIDLQRPVTP